MEINKIYCKLDENKVIQGYFICFAKQPKYRAMGCNFDEAVDFENGVVIDSKYLNVIVVGQSKVIKGKVINEGE